MNKELRRRQEGKTDYATRLKLLKSKFPRLAIRKSNKYITAQIVESKEAQDRTVCLANSKELSSLGWKFSYKNIPAAYATGILIAKKANEKKINKVILDLARYTSSKGSKIYALVKGAIDAGLDINCKPEMFPKEESISGKYTKNSEKIKEIIGKLKNKNK